MKERPILFSGPMVNAIREGRKTQTRRIVRESPMDICTFLGANRRPTGEYGLCLESERVITKHVRCPYGKPGDRLWVRETHSVQPCNCCVRYKADDDLLDAGEKWQPSIFMYRKDSRITLEITNVRVERLHDLSESGAEAEGVSSTFAGSFEIPARDAFQSLWQKINGKKCPWASNPWVWVVEFRKI